jgi:hypothetical protein
MELSDTVLVAVASIAIVIAVVASKNALVVVAMLLLVAAICWLAVTRQQPAPAIAAAAVAQCDTRAAECPLNKCSIQSLDNPFANPLTSDFGDPRMFEDVCSLTNANSLMQERATLGGVQFADDSVFYKVPSRDQTDFVQWLFSTPSNCRYDQGACTAPPAIRSQWL